jgi:hypothetical protein
MYRILGIAVVSSLVVTAPRANTQHIAFTSGFQTGTVDVKGTANGGPGSPAWSYPDTLLIDSTVRVVVFTEVWNYRRATYSGDRGHWLFLENTGGSIGFRSLSDTVWTSSMMFYTASLGIDSVVPQQNDFLAPQEWTPSNLSGTGYGIRIGSRRYGGLGYVNKYEPYPGATRIVYFRYARNGSTRYGKLQVQAQVKYSSPPPYVTDGPYVELEKATIAYALSDTATLNNDPVGIQPFRVGASAGTIRKGLVFSQKQGVLWRDGRGKLYNLRGERLRAPAGTP